jgi:outer membrane protein, multidrug efflux system
VSARLSRLATTVAVLAAALLAACTVGPDHVAPELALPGQWPVPLPDAAGAGTGVVAIAGAADSAGDSASDPAAGLSRWWTAFGDSQLDALVEVALRDSLDLQRAASRVREARALRRLAGARDDLQLDAVAGASRTGRSENAFSTAGVPGRTANLFELGFDALWELDLFGGTRRAVEAADADLAAAQERRRDVLVTLVAEIAREYLALRSAQRRLDIAEHNLGLQSDTLELTRSRQRAGLGTSLDVTRAEAQQAGTRATIPALQSAERSALHRLDVLLGRPAGTGAAALLGADATDPDAVRADAAGGDAGADDARESGAAGTADAAGADGIGRVPPPPPRVPVGLPSELLRRRPDVRAAERDLAAATARIGVATADLWPRFSLTGALGLSAEHSSDLADGDSRFWSLGGGLRWPLLDGGAIRATIELSDARAQDALLAWRQVALAAFAETADALVALGREQERRALLAERADAQRRAEKLAHELHDAGLLDFLDVLIAQAARLAAEDDLALSELALSQDYVALCKALGGGWDALPEDGFPGDDGAQTPVATSTPDDAP